MNVLTRIGFAVLLVLMVGVGPIQADDPAISLDKPIVGEAFVQVNGKSVFPENTPLTVEWFAGGERVEQLTAYVQVGGAIAIELYYPAGKTKVTMKQGQYSVKVNFSQAQAKAQGLDVAQEDVTVTSNFVIGDLKKAKENEALERAKLEALVKRSAAAFVTMVDYANLTVEAAFAAGADNKEIVKMLLQMWEDHLKLTVDPVLKDLKTYWDAHSGATIVVPAAHDPFIDLYRYMDSLRKSMPEWVCHTDRLNLAIPAFLPQGKGEHHAEGTVKGILESFKDIDAALELDLKYKPIYPM